MRTDRALLNPVHEWTDADVEAWKHACAVHGIDPILLLKCAAHESGCNPSAIHKWTDPRTGEVHYGAAGLIQVEPGNLSPLGFHGSPLEFSQLSVEEQMRFNGNYLGWFPALRGKGLAGLYCGLFLPALIAVADAHIDEPLCGARGPFAEFYEPNIVFDVPDAGGKRKGYITAYDLVRAAEAAFASSEVARAIAAKLSPEPIESAIAGEPTPLDIPGMNAPVDDSPEEPPTTPEGHAARGAA